MAIGRKFDFDARNDLQRWVRAQSLPKWRTKQGQSKATGTEAKNLPFIFDRARSAPHLISSDGQTNYGTGLDFASLFFWPRPIGWPAMVS